MNIQLSIMKFKSFSNPNCIIYVRKGKKDEGEAFCNYGAQKVTKLMNVLEEVVKLWTDIKRIYVYAENRYHDAASHVATSYLHLQFSKLERANCFPLTDTTSLPNVIPVTLSEEKQSWDDVDCIAVLPGWDFYDIHWILRHWEKSLGSYDFDSFLNIPSYPRDLYNNNVHPDIVVFILNQYVQTFSLMQLKEKFFGLYHFYKDSLGKKMLSFFYDCCERSLSNESIYKMLHSMYHSTGENHPFRIYLYYLNKGLQNSGSRKKSFKIQLFISQFLSYESMFICNNYFEQRLPLLVAGIFQNYTWLRSVFEFSSLQHVEDMLRIEWQHLYEDFPSEEKLTWIGKHHVQKLQKKSKFWKYISIHWEHFNRNIFLWEIQNYKYGDSQFGSGYPLVDYFPESWTIHFENKNYVPVVESSRKKKAS